MESSEGMSTMTEARTYTATEARDNFSEVIDQAHHEGLVFVTKHKKKVAVVSVEYLRALTTLEAEFDTEKARESLKEFLKTGGKTMKQMKADLDIP